MGAVRSRPQRLSLRQSRSQLLHDGEGPSRRQAGSDLRCSQVRPALLPPAAQHGPRRRLRRPGLTSAGDGGQGRSLQHHGSLRRSAPARRTPASFRAGRPYNTDTIALPELTGDIRITIVVADDITFVEHPGNAERPHVAADRPTPSLHRPSGWSRSYVLASLRALHLDQRLRPEPHAKRALTDGATQVTPPCAPALAGWASIPTRRPDRLSSVTTPPSAGRHLTRQNQTGGPEDDQAQTTDAHP